MLDPLFLFAALPAFREEVEPHVFMQQQHLDLLEF
jgi:hypothetical protein